MCSVYDGLSLENEHLVENVDMLQHDLRFSIRELSQLVAQLSTKNNTVEEETTGLVARQDLGMTSGGKTQMARQNLNMDSEKIDAKSE